MKKFIFLILLALFMFLPAHAEFAEAFSTQVGRVQNITYENVDADVAQANQKVDIKLLEGDLKGLEITLDNLLTGNPYYDIKLKKGMKVILHVEDTVDGKIFSIQDIKRSSILVWLSALFCGLLVYVGRKKGLNSIISIGVTCILICNILAPMILYGINPIVATILICILSTIVTMYLVGGVNRKSSSAIIGCTLSVVFAGILSSLTVKIASLTGFNSEQTMFLYSVHPELSFTGILVSAMILATLGAVMDVAMSIASTINEIHEVDKSKSVKDLFVSGMNVGKDIIGTMANTLILVYLGASLPLLLLSTNIDLQKFINLNQVVTEIASALIGSCAIVICVPITAIVASELVKNLKTKRSAEELEI